MTELAKTANRLILTRRGSLMYVTAGTFRATLDQLTNVYLRSLGYSYKQIAIVRNTSVVAEKQRVERMRVKNRHTPSSCGISLYHSAHQRGLMDPLVLTALGMLKWNWDRDPDTNSRKKAIFTIPVSENAQISQ